MRTIQQKSMAILSLTTVLIMAAIFIIAYRFAAAYFAERVEQQIQRSNDALAVVLREPIFAYDTSIANNIISQYVKEPHIHQIRVSDHRGKALTQLQEDSSPLNVQQTQLDVQWGDGKVIGNVHVTYRLDSYDGALTFIALLLSVIALILIIGLQAVNWWVLEKYVTRPIRQMAAAMFDVARGEGDLTKRISLKRDDEVGQFALAFNAFIENMDQMVGRIVKSAEDLLACSVQIKDSAQHNSDASQEQINAVQAFDAALQEMQLASSSVADGAFVTSQKTTNCNQVAQDSNTIVTTTANEIRALGDTISVASERISQLRDKSKAINTVLDVIKEIAEQTNLLALNAAIEAARAGEQGRGFAVVADEVRALAQRTQHSTAEIENIINELNLSSDDANQLILLTKDNVNKTIGETDRTLAALQTILDNVADITLQNQTVAAAAEQEKDVAGGVVARIGNFKQVTHAAAENAVNVLDLSQELDRLGDLIKADLSKFKLSA
jgi:methyl-accepting chemotaxis protein